MYMVGRQHSHRSPARAPILASEARAECSSAAALSSTCFGIAVDPEVGTMTAVPSATPIFWPERSVVTPSGPLHARRGQRLHQRGQPGRREPGVQRRNGRAAAIQRRGQQVEQSRSGALHQDRMQRTVRHDR